MEVSAFLDSSDTQLSSPLYACSLPNIATDRSSSSRKETFTSVLCLLAGRLGSLGASPLVALHTGYPVETGAHTRPATARTADVLP